jgi:CPA2 family monovalent cation:H+ antiporter-2
VLGLGDLAVVLVLLVVAGFLAARLGISGIPIYIGAGILLGPHEPEVFSLVEVSEGIDLLARIGIVLLLFYLGLEFSLARLTQARGLVLVGGSVDLVLNAGVGLALGLAFMGPGAEAVLIAGLVYISSSGIITRALFDLRRLADDETDLVLGILVFEDLAIAVFLGIAAALASGEAVGGGKIVLTSGIALAFVAAFLVASRWAHVLVDRITPRLEAEQILLGALAIALGGAALAELAGLSEAIGALLAGVLLSGSDARDRIEQQLLGLRDFAGAIFFFAFGLEVDLGRTGSVGWWLAAAIPAAVVAKLVGGYAAGRLTSFSRRGSLDVGATLIARGEFTIILAQLAAAGVALDPTFRDRVGPFAGIFVVATAALGVLSMRESRRVGRAVFRPARVPERP